MSRFSLLFLALLLLPFPALALSPEAEDPASTGEIPAPAELPLARLPEEPRSFLTWIGEGFSLHRQNYLLPLTWGNAASAREDAELVFQFSFKQRLARSGFYLAYTQKSFWRILDGDDSRPFRETNYNPEFFYRHTRPSPWGSWGADAGIEHESNGAREPTSRSWNRLYLSPFFEYGKFRTDLKLWRRLSEEKKESPDDPHGDENPDITDFYGYGELRLAYEFPNNHMASLMGRWNFATDNGGVQFHYSIPTPTNDLFLFLHFWSGYGESLIDYNRSVTRYGVGLMFKR